MEKKMLSITDGKSGTYAMLPSDRKAVAEARSFSSKYKDEIAETQSNFADKGSFGLWWDAIGIFKTSDKTAVTEHMERYRKFYEDVVTFTDMVNKGDKSSYKKLLDIYSKLDEMDMDAERERKNINSKAICKIVKKFLSSKYTLDHNLKRVECVVLRQKLEEVEEACKNSTEAIKNMAEQVSNLLKENQKKKEEKKELKTAMEEKMKELSLEADKRCETLRQESDQKLKEMVEEANAKAEARCQKMLERNQSDMRKILKKLESMDKP